MSTTRDPFDLERFVSAQERSFAAALSELQAGQKRSHWMWYIFPQLRGLGTSSMAQTYGIGSLNEAVAYLGHPLLGERLRACTEAVLQSRDRTLHQIFGSPDDVKFYASMTLFAVARGGDGGIYRDALARFCANAMDERTLGILQAQP